MFTWKLSRTMSNYLIKLTLNQQLHLIDCLPMTESECTAIQSFTCVRVILIFTQKKTHWTLGAFVIRAAKMMRIHSAPHGAKHSKIQLRETSMKTKELLFKEQRKLTARLHKLDLQQSKAKRELEAKERRIRYELDGDKRVKELQMEILTLRKELAIASRRAASAAVFYQNQNKDGENTTKQNVKAINTDSDLLRNIESQIFRQKHGLEPTQSAPTTPKPQPQAHTQFIKVRSRSLPSNYTLPRRRITTARRVDHVIRLRNMSFMKTNEECKELSRLERGGAPKEGLNPMFLPLMKDNIKSREKARLHETPADDSSEDNDSTKQEETPRYKVSKVFKQKVKALQMINRWKGIPEEKGEMLEKQDVGQTETQNTENSQSSARSFKALAKQVSINNKWKSAALQTVFNKKKEEQKQIHLTDVAAISMKVSIFGFRIVRLVNRK